MIDPDGYRPNVGIVLMRPDGRVFWARRVRRDGWQFPQGGIIMCCRAAHDASHFATPPFFITRRIYFSFFKKKMKEKA